MSSTDNKQIEEELSKMTLKEGDSWADSVVEGKGMYKNRAPGGSSTLKIHQQ